MAVLIHGKTHWDLDEMAACLQMTFSMHFSWRKSFVFWLKLHWNLFSLSLCFLSLSLSLSFSLYIYIYIYICIYDKLLKSMDSLKQVTAMFTVELQWRHMGVITSQITSKCLFNSFFGITKRKRKGFTLLALCEENYGRRVDSPRKGPMLHKSWRQNHIVWPQVAPPSSKFLD